MKQPFVPHENHSQEFDGLNNFEVARMLFVPASVKVFDDLVDAFKVDGRLGEAPSAHPSYNCSLKSIAHVQMSSV